MNFSLAGKNYIPNFQIFEKSDVNGHSERPLFTYLKVNSSLSLSRIIQSPSFQSLCPSPIDEFHPYPNISYTPIRSNDLRWNFEKFLIDGYGRPVKRFASEVSPSELVSDIDQLRHRRKYLLKPIL